MCVKAIFHFSQNSARSLFRERYLARASKQREINKNI